MSISSSDRIKGNQAYHSDKQPGLLCSAPNTSITYDTNGKASSKTRKPDRKTRAKLDEAGVQRHTGRD